MKKMIRLMICLSVFLLIAGCGGGKPEEPPLPIKIPLESQIPSKSYDDQLILQARVQQGKTVDGLDYYYQMPQLDSDQPTAQKINEEIRNYVQPVIDESMKMIEASEPPLYKLISWKTTWNGSLMSMMLIMENEYGYNDHAVFNYDFADDKVLDNRALLRKKNMDEDAVIKALRKASATHFDKGNKEWVTVDYFAGFADLRCRTISQENLNLDTVSLFLDDQGKLQALAPEASFAAAGSIMTVLDLEPPTQTMLEKQVSWNFVTAQLKNDQVTVTFSETEDSSMYMPASLGIIYDYPYMVKGLYGHYTDILVGNLDYTLSPYIVLVDDEGMLTFCNLMLCTGSGIELNAVGPYRSEQAVESFDLVELEGQEVVVTITENNEYHFIGEEAYRLCNSFNYLLDENTWIDESGVYTLMSDGINNNIVFAGGGGILATGEMRYAGMNEKGQIFPVYCHDEAGGNIEGHLTLNTYNTYIAPEGVCNLMFTQFSGEQLFGSEGQYQTVFNLQY